MSFLADRSAVSIGLGGIPSLRSGTGGLNPSLDLNFAVSKSLDPRITFTRASEARYYDASTVAVAEQNLLTYSQAFDNAAWVKTTTTVAADSFAAPDGTTTAETLTAGGTNSTVLQTFTALALPYTFSVWLYRKTGTGNVDISVDGATWVTQTLTAGWTRFNTTLTPSAGAKTAGVRLVTSGDEVYVWGAQLEQRSTVTAYTPTTTAAVTNYIPVLQTAANGVARFDHNPVTRESLGLLIEEQRTNLVTYSEQFDNAAWTKSSATVSPNVTIAPDGAMTADKLVSNNGAVRGAVLSTSVSVGQTLSVYAKAGEWTRVAIGSSNATGLWAVSTFNLSTGTTDGGASYGGNTVSGALITAVGNGWYRCSVQITALSAGSVAVIMPFNQSGDPVIPSPSLTGNGFSGIYIWGAQLEAGAFATSYIPTTTAQVTRSADAASMTGTNFSSWYRQDEGTLFAQAYSQSTFANSVDNDLVEANDGTQANYFGTRAGLYQGYQAGQLVSVAANGVSRARNGVITAIAQPTNQLPKTTLQIGVGLQYYRTPGWYRRITYYPVRLANATLQSLTA